MGDLINIVEKEDVLFVSSREVSENFNKEHRNVLRDINEIISKLEGSAQNIAHLFIESEYVHPQNKQVYREYLLTRDGFSILVMGFTGEKALQWKMKYIEAFNKMEESLRALIPHKPLSPAEILMQQAQFMMEQERVNNELKQEIQVLKLDNQQILSEQKEIKEVVARSTSLREGDMTAEAIAREFLIFSSNSGRPHGSFANLLAMELEIYLPPEGNIGYRDDYISVGTKQRNGVDVATVKYSEKARDLMKDSIENEGLRFGNPTYWKKGEKKGLFNKCQITFDGGNIWINETTYKDFNGDFE